MPSKSLWLICSISGVTYLVNVCDVSLVHFKYYHVLHGFKPGFVMFTSSFVRSKNAGPTTSIANGFGVAGSYSGNPGWSDGIQFLYGDCLYPRSAGKADESRLSSLVRNSIVIGDQDSWPLVKAVRINLF
ncbi:hypothetical protein QQP08_015767 [Theobroma cacao]|nr:hypothetical protein QQP08_015767 [Theobroma cacao]